MSAKRKACLKPIGRGLCSYERAPGLQQCRWHWLLKQSAVVQKHEAERRLAAPPRTEPRRARVPQAEWPAGERWCSGCQSFVPLFYCSGSRCKSCASEASHGAHVEKTYGITRDEYAQLLEFQGGRCYVCRRNPGKRRLAVDHDHVTGDVRGLLCSDNERGCNHAVLGSLEGSQGGNLAAARRLVEYLEDPPWARIGRGETMATRLDLPVSEKTVDVDFNEPAPF